MSHVIDVDGWSYQECQSQFQQILEIGHLTGHVVTKADGDAVADDAVEDFVQLMVRSGWAVETARQCRNGAAGRALRRSGPRKALEKLSTRKTITIGG